MIKNTIMDFTKTDIEQIRIDVESEGQSALSMLIHKDGTLNRQGNGSFPPVKVAAIGMTDGAIFRKLVDALDERIFEQAGIYDHPNKQGQQIRYSLAFIGQKPKIKVIEFRVGLENKDVGDLLPYVDRFINAAAQMTNDWYDKAVKNSDNKSEKIDTSNKQSESKKKWWKFGK
jgi:hypothetical protein